mgnify:FL=1
MERIKNKNILITGGHGFIGRNLSEYFMNRHTVFAPSHHELDLLDEDAVKKFIKKKRIDIIIHGANVGGGRDTTDIQKVAYQNIRMFFSIIRNASEVEKTIHFGSGAGYDMRYYRPKMREDQFGAHIPVDEYGFAKYVCSKYITAHNQSNVIEFRLFGVYGKYEKYSIKFISNVIVKNIFSLPITISQNVFFDYIYIDDLIKVVEYFIVNPSTYRTYNVTTGKTIDLLTIANIVNKFGRIHGHKESKINIMHPGLGYEYSGDNRRLREVFQKLEFISHEDAIHALYKWYLSIKDSLDSSLIERGDKEYLKHCRIKYETKKGFGDGGL